MNTISFQRWLVILNGLVPCALLLWDAWSGQLGANSVNIALHITGILSLFFLVLSLLMTPLKVITGWGGWIAFRRALGLYGFFYAAAHLVIYVVYDRAGSLQSTLSEIASRRFLQVGAVALLLMVPLAVTSTNDMIRRMGASRWKKLHRLAYAAAILGVLHYYMLVKSDVRQPLAFAAVLGMLLGFRITPTSRLTANRKVAGRNTAGHPKAESLIVESATRTEQVVTSAVPGPAAENTGRWKGELRVCGIQQETHNVRTFRLQTLDGTMLPFEWQAGQFLNVQLLIGGKRVNRSYTIASSPVRRQWLELTVKREPQGVASSYLHDQVCEGDVIAVSGPAGRFTFPSQSEPRVLMIAGGVGLTPVMSILRTLHASMWQGSMELVISAKTEMDLIFRQELEILCQQSPTWNVHITLTQCTEADTWSGRRGRISAGLLQSCLSHPKETPVYLCGPTEMTQSVRGLLISLGVPESRFHIESFGGAKPGIAERAFRVQAAAEHFVPEVKDTATHSVNFVRSGRSVPIDQETTLLEAAEQLNIPVDFECRSGICGQCRLRLLSGTVVMHAEDALTASDRRSGIILACQARATSSVAVDC